MKEINNFVSDHNYHNRLRCIEVNLIYSYFHHHKRIFLTSDVFSYRTKIRRKEMIQTEILNNFYCKISRDFFYLCLTARLNPILISCLDKKFVDQLLVKINDDYDNLKLVYSMICEKDIIKKSIEEYLK